MADHHQEVFIYTGGRVPEHLKQHITHVVIDLSVRSIDDFAFYECPHLVNVDCHDGVLKVGREAFAHCPSLQYVRMAGVTVVEDAAFFDDQNLLGADFGSIEIIRFAAFSQCISLRFFASKTVKDIGVAAFFCCEQLTDAEFGDNLERVGKRAFRRCFNLRRIVMPLKKRVLDCDVFNYCENLVRVDFIGNVLETVSFLSMHSWRNDIEEQIKWVNRFLPTISSSMKTMALQQWIESILDKLNYYKTEHYKLLKEAATDLELALWKTKLENERVQVWDKRQREECRFVCKSNIVIPSVVSFLLIPEE